MAVVVLKIPNTTSNNLKRPKSCPNCASQVIQSWGSTTRNIQDIGAESVEIHRYLCNQCGQTFRWYPEGYSQKLTSQRVRRLGVIAVLLGTSYRETERFLWRLGLTISRSTLCRDVHNLQEQISKEYPGGSFPSYSIDTMYAHRISNLLGVVVATCLEDRKYEVLGTLNEINPNNVIAWLKLLAQDSGIEIDAVEVQMLDHIYLPENNSKMPIN
jgi:transposase-like protein